MTEPLITVVVVTYNHERFIRDAVQSVLGQSVSVPCEVLVTEDASTDRTRDIVQAYASEHANVRLLASERNLNSNEVSLRAICAARGRYVAVIDGDDVWISPDKLERQFRCMEAHTDVAVCFHDMKVMDSDGRTIEATFVGSDVAVDTGLAEILVGNYIPGSAPMFRRSAILPPAPFLENVAYFDWALLIAAARFGGIRLIPDVFGAYRRHGGGVWSGLSELQKATGLVRFYDQLEPHFWPEWQLALRQARAGWRANLLNLLHTRGTRAEINAEIASGVQAGDIAAAESTDMRPSLRLRIANGKTSQGRRLGSVGFIDEVRRSDDGADLIVAGWTALRDNDPAPTIEIETDDRVISAAAVRIPRPDVARTVDFSLKRSGFWLRIALEASQSRRIELTLTDSQGNRCAVGSIAPAVSS